LKSKITWLVPCVALMAACGGHASGGGMPDLASGDVAPAPTSLSLSIRFKPPTGGDLVITGDELDLKDISLFGDVAADARTMLNEQSIGLPDGKLKFDFDQAPYGLYSRVQIKLDDIHIRGTWKGSPLSVRFEGGPLTADLRGPALDYEPTASARYEVTIDTTTWFDPAALDGAVGAGTATGITVDYLNNQLLIPGIAAAIFGSFTLDEAHGENG
jgi:hypothetical protein